jgi:hypothetical protein
MTRRPHVRRGLLALLVCASTALALTAAPASAQLKSDNVELLGKVPDSAGAIGARFSPDGRTMYVTGATGLQIYDVTQAAAPRKLSQLALPHLENEDVDVGPGVVVISNDPSFTGVGALYLIDVSNPSRPYLRSTLTTNVPLLGTNNSDNGHIASCIHNCAFLYTTGTAEGLTVYDIRDLDNPRYVKAITMPAGGGFTHDVHVDATGIAWVSGEDGTFGFDVADPLNPVLRYRSDETITNTGGGLPGQDGSGPLDFLHHNMLRTSINVSDTGRVSQAKVPGTGNVLAVTEEDYAKPTCEGQGSLQTWRITSQRNSDGSIKLELLDLWTTELNELANATGRSPATANCSAHWFDEDRGLIAQGWYDQGVRFIDASQPRDLKQVGYWTTTGTFWAAYYAPTDPSRQTVYALDITSGLDVLRIDRPNATKERRKPAKESELGTTNQPAGTPHETFGYACPLPVAAAL